MRRSASDVTPNGSARDRRGQLLGAGLDQLVQHGLRGVWLRGAPPERPFVWSANHHSWWDGFVANSLLRVWNRPGALLMDPDNLEQFGMMRRLGVVGSVRAAAQSLADGAVLVVFPEGELRPAAALGPLRPGAEWFARRAEAPLVAAATRIVLRGHQHAEAYVDLHVTGPGDDLQTVLGERLAALDAELAASDPREPLPGFVRVVRGAKAWDERIAGWSRKG